MRLTLALLCLTILAAGCQQAAKKPPKTEAEYLAELRAAGVKVGFFEMKTDPRRIVFVVNRSTTAGSDDVELKRLINDELKRSIHALKPNQQFYVILYSGGEEPSRGLAHAYPHNIDKALEFIDSGVPAREIGLATALTRAFEVDPDTVYILSYGYDGVDPYIEPLIDRLNTGHKTVINTICFKSDDDDDSLKRIAEENGGKYKFVSGEDVPKPSK
jgi:hypothetical protein